MTEKQRTFTVSARPVSSHWRIYSMLETRFLSLGLGDMTKVNSVFGAMQMFSPLYGGRPYRPQHSLSFRQLRALERKSLNLWLTLSNHDFTEEKYKETIPLLKRIHREGHGIVVNNDLLAKRLRNDFPLFKLKASVLKKIETLEGIHNALELYDFVALMPYLNDRDELLRSIDCKDKVVLFASSRCLYHCGGDYCFPKISERMAKDKSQRKIPCENEGNRALKKLKVFDLSEPKYEGYYNFKVVL